MCCSFSNIRFFLPPGGIRRRKGASVERNPDPMSSFSAEAEEAEAAVYTVPEAPQTQFDMRWVFVTAVLAMLIAGFIIWLAFQTMPATRAQDSAAAHARTTPYQLFQQLSRSAEQTMASWGWTSHASNIKASAGQPGYIPLRQNGPQDLTERRTLTMDSGDTLAGVLENAGISASEVQKAMVAMGRVFSPRSLRAGQNFDIVLTPAAAPVDAGSEADDSTDDGEPQMQLTSLKFSPSIEHDVTITRTADGDFTAADITKPLVQHMHHAGTTIDSSLYMSAMHAGIPADVVVQMIRMFSYKVDFQRDIQPGDSFEVFYDYYYTPAGQPAKVGNISFAKMTLGGRVISLYRFQPDPDSPAEYYDADGRSAKGLLMKTPVDGARITSGFGMRHHPILGYTRMHKGVDFGVPIGTPVMAAGGGVVQFAGRANGYGNFLLIKHANGISTGYGHLSRFARGIHRGSRVHQAELVAYSGMTGMATGPHLHYEIRVNGSQVNPMTFKTNEGRMLTGKERREFLSTRKQIDRQMRQTNMETKVADISGDTVKK